MKFDLKNCAKLAAAVLVLANVLGFLAYVTGAPAWFAVPLAGTVSFTVSFVLALVVWPIVRFD